MFESYRGRPTKMMKDTNLLPIIFMVFILLCISSCDGGAVSSSNSAPAPSPTPQHGKYTVGGLGARKQAILKHGGNVLDVAIAMLETNTMQANYIYGDSKTLDSANFGIFKQNWFMIRTSVKEYASLTAADYNVGARLNKSLDWDIQVLHTSQQKYGMEKWFAGHRDGQTGVEDPNTADITNYKNAVYWIRDQLSSESKYLGDDTRFYVKVQAI